MVTSSIFLFLLVLLGESALWLPLQLSRRTIATLLACLLPPATLLLAGYYTNVFTIFLILIAAYRTVNLARIAAERRQADHLYTASKHTSAWLIGFQLLSLYFVITPVSSLRALAGGFLLLTIVVGTIILFASVTRTLRTTRPVAGPKILDKDLPTVSVLIPARDETEDLVACLESLVACTYPKLEIIVLDDRSQNKRTPEIIKGFANAGVRFIAGKVAPTNWLAKNYAYQQLADTANGEVLLFCGVDTRFTSNALQQMVSELVQNNKTMVGFIPANAAPAPFALEALFVQPMRYAWELALPRRFLQRPPVLSTAWMIKRATLTDTGGFKSASRAIVPERFLARYAVQHGDGYSFQQSITGNGVSSAKSFSDQKATAIRTRYPQLHQSVEFTLLTSTLEFCVLIVPFIVLLRSAIFHDYGLLFYASLACCLLAISVYAQVVALTYRRPLLRSLWLLPFAALYDIILLNYSMLLYEFSTVDWKGRNVTVPVMRVIDQLPKV